MKRCHYGVAGMVMLLAILGVADAGAYPGAFYFQTHGPYGDDSAYQSYDMPCGSGDSVVSFVITFEPAQDMTDFVALDVIIDGLANYPAGGADTPPFWRLDPDGCNADGLGSSLSPPGDLAGYTNPWINPYSGTGTFATHGPTGHERWGLAAFRASPIVLHAGQKYFGGVITLPVCPAAFCAGCSSEFTLWATQAYMRSLSGADQALNGGSLLCINQHGWCGVTADVGTRAGSDAADQELLRSLKSKSRSFATASVCDPVATVKRTWGNLKLMYR